MTLFDFLKEAVPIEELIDRWADIQKSGGPLLIGQVNPSPTARSRIVRAELIVAYDSLDRSMMILFGKERMEQWGTESELPDCDRLLIELRLKSVPGEKHNFYNAALLGVLVNWIGEAKGLDLLTLASEMADKIKIWE